MSRGLTRAGLTRDIISLDPPVLDLCLNFGPCRIKVSCNDPRVEQELRDYFGPFVSCTGPQDIAISVIQARPPELDLPFSIKEREPGKSKTKEEYVDLVDGRIVRKRLTGMVFVFGRGENLAVGPCLEHPNQVVNFINNRYIEWLLCRGLLLGHAAAVAHGTRGLALAGFSGAGKSTLALHLMSRGATFVSNDRLLVESCASGLVMHGVPKLPRINPGTSLHNPDLTQVLSDEERKRFSSLPPKDLWELEHKYDVDIASCFGRGRFVLSAPMNGLFILNWQRNNDPLHMQEVDLGHRRDLLPAFMKSPGLFFHPDRECSEARLSPDEYEEGLGRCRVFELTGGVDFDRAAELAMAFLAG